MINRIDLKSIILTEKNIDSLRTREDRTFNIKKLLGVSLTQSQAIKFGNIFQNIIKDIVKNAGGEVLTQQFADVYGVGDTKLHKGHKDVDIWFKIEDRMYYFEAKTNLDLDSEKSKATNNKVDDITRWMKKTYPDFIVVSGILTCWWTREEGLPVKVQNVYFMEDFFNIIDVPMTKKEYYNLMIEFGKSIK